MDRLEQRSSDPGTCSVIRTGALVASLPAGAGLMAAGIASPGHAWLGLIGLLPVFLVIRRWRPVPALIGGMLWGISLGVVSARVPGSPIAISVESFLLLTLVPALYTCAGAWLTRWMGFNPFILGFAWMGVELALARTGVGNGVLAGTFAHGGFMQVVGSLLGYVLAAFIAAFLCALVISALAHLALVGDAWAVRWALPPCPRSAHYGEGTLHSLLTFACARPRAPPSDVGRHRGIVPLLAACSH